MPRLFVANAAQGFTGSPFFANLDAPVGPGRANRRPDVILVQFLMHASRKQWTDPRSSIDRDGIFGSETRDAILIFQKNVTGLFGGVLRKIDGVVDPVRSGATVRTATLGWMTHLYLVENRTLWPDFRGHIDWPGFEGMGLFL